jgi:hypothetical protein
MRVCDLFLRIFLGFLIIILLGNEGKVRAFQFKDSRVSISSYTFLNNLEYVGDVDQYSTIISNNATQETIFLGEGQTFFGEHLALEAIHQEGNFLFYRFGVLGTHLYGDEKNFHKVRPLVSIAYIVPKEASSTWEDNFFSEKKGKEYKFYLIFGSIINGPRNKFIEPLYDDSLFYYRPVEEGLAIGQSGTLGSYDAWINWQRLNTPFHRERFDIGIVSKLKKRGFHWDFQFHYVHEGGQLYHPGPVKDNFGVASGPELVLGRARFRVSGCYSYDIPDRGKPETFSEGWGIESSIIFKVKKMQVFLEHWIGKDFRTAEGDPFYQADWLVKFGFLHKWKLTKHCILLLGARGYWVKGTFTHDERLEIRYYINYTPNK